MKFRHILSLSLGAALVAACNSSEDAENAEEGAQPAPAITQAPVPTAAPDGTALVPGSWQVNENPQGGRATFGEESGEATLSILCERTTGTVTLNLTTAASEAEAWRIDAGGEAARIDMTPAAGGLSAEIEPSLAIFHAFSNPGEIVVLTSPAGERMQFPTHPGISRVLYACS